MLRARFKHNKPGHDNEPGTLACQADVPITTMPLINSMIHQFITVTTKPVTTKDLSNIIPTHELLAARLKSKKLNYKSHLHRLRTQPWRCWTSSSFPSRWLRVSPRLPWCTPRRPWQQREFYQFYIKFKLVDSFDLCGKCGCWKYNVLLLFDDQTYTDTRAKPDKVSLAKQQIRLNYFGQAGVRSRRSLVGTDKLLLATTSTSQRLFDRPKCCMYSPCSREIFNCRNFRKYSFHIWYVASMVVGPAVIFTSRITELHFAVHI